MREVARGRASPAEAAVISGPELVERVVDLLLLDSEVAEHARYAVEQTAELRCVRRQQADKLGDGVNQGGDEGKHEGIDDQQRHEHADPGGHAAPSPR